MTLCCHERGPSGLDSVAAAQTGQREKIAIGATGVSHCHTVRQKGYCGNRRSPCPAECKQCSAWIAIGVDAGRVGGIQVSSNLRRKDIKRGALVSHMIGRLAQAGKLSGAGRDTATHGRKREGKPSEDAILASRVIDRTLRPLFDQSIRHAVQVIVTVISVDDNDSTILAVNAASLALAVSNIPWNGPIGCVRIGKYDDETLKINPSQKLRASDDIYKFDLKINICSVILN